MNRGVLIGVVIGVVFRMLPQIAAEDGFTTLGDTSYKLFKNKKTHTDATTACRELKSILAEPSTESINTAIQALVNNAVDEIWLGATDIDVEDKWTWQSNGKVLSYTDWGRGQPDNGGLNEVLPQNELDSLTLFENCLATTATAWFDSDCRLSRCYICMKPATAKVPPPQKPTTEIPLTEIPTTEIPTTEIPLTEIPLTEIPTTEIPTTEIPTTEIPTTKIRPPEHPCPDSFSVRDTKCYQFVSEAKPHTKAAASCVEKGGYLAEPLEDADNDVIHAVMEDHNAEFAWIGAEDILYFRVFVWQHGGNITSSHWAPGQPSPWEEIQHCLAYQLDDTSSGWNDQTCYEELPFICQAKPRETAVSADDVASGDVARGATGNAEQPSHASLVELLVGAILTKWVVVRVASGRCQ